MSEIRYTVNNTKNTELINAAINYVKNIQDFKEAQAEAENLKEKYMKLGYPHVGIDAWIECEIGIGSDDRYSYTTYAKAKTAHSNDHQYVSQNTEHIKDIISRNYTRQRNELGQKIIDILTAMRKAREELAEFRNSVLKEIVQKNGFNFAGNEYTISEKSPQDEFDE